MEADFNYCIFSSRKSIDIIKENIPFGRTYLVDATFSIVPQGCFKQTLVIYIQYFDDIIPIFFILMDKKSKAAYIHLFDYITNNVFDLQPETFISDYEPALRHSISTVFEGVKLIGCWFHFCQAVRRNVMSKRLLYNCIKKSKPMTVEYHKLLALPLLPPVLICSAFQEIKNKLLLMDGECKLSSFLKYYEKHWLQKIGPENISVYNQCTRTTSSVEAYNGFLGKLIAKSGNFFKFVGSLRKEEFFKSRHFEILAESGGSSVKRRRRSTKEARIAEAANLLEKGKINALAFLNRMVFEENAICTNMLPMENEVYDEADEDKKDEDEVEQKEESNVRICVVCYDKMPKIVLLPCRHLVVCVECHLKLQAVALENNSDTFNCPYCRAVVQETLQIY
ncbi:uncharacterized protein [Musca autumnalis]|uniref:uncharacterized protein n=1 Tax=Musca autumnalis TaxID=221902 RepID=UPI003CF6F229